MNQTPQTARSTRGKKRSIGAEAFRVVQEERGVDARGVFLDDGEFLLVEKDCCIDAGEFFLVEKSCGVDDGRFFHDDEEFLLVQKSSVMAFIRR